MKFMSERQRLVYAVNKWRAVFLTVTICGAATIYYRTTLDHRPIALAASAVSFAFPLVILALIAFDFGKEWGRESGHEEGYASGYREGEYTIDLLRKHLKERDRHLSLIESIGAQASTRGRAIVAEAVAEARYDTAPLPHGRNMQIALAVQDHFWNLDRFDPSDTDTWPAQKDIIEFIMAEEAGISKARAAAIEITACPVKR